MTIPDTEMENAFFQTNLDASTRITDMQGMYSIETRSVQPEHRSEY
jgi:hypothetical protein